MNRHGPSVVVPWLVPLTVSVTGLLLIDVPLGPIVRYAAYFASCVALPGVLLLRALWRSTGNWAEDIGLGSAVGIAYQLAGWALFTWLGWQDALVVWPLLVLAAFGLVPQLRPYWRIAAPEPLPTAWAWGLAICLSLLALATTLGVMADHAPPPDGLSYYPDMLYHLSMVSELERSVPPQLPQVAGEALEYHWLPNADIAGAVDITGLSPALVLYRLWLLPVVLVGLLAAAALARLVSGVWWTGLLVGLIFIVPQLGYFVPAWPKVDLSGQVSLLSPSQTLAALTVAAAAYFVIVALHRDGGRGVWVLAAAVAVVGGGSKPTVLPILLGGVGLSALFLLVRDRRIPWRSAVFGVLLAAIAVGTLLTVAGSTSGSNVQFLAIAKFQAGYRGATGDGSLPGTGGLLLPSLTGDQLAVMGAVVVLAAFVLAQAGLVAGFALSRVKAVRQDPVAWWLVGALTASWLGLCLVDHPSASQYYFLRSGIPIAAAAVSWLIAAGVQGRSRRTSLSVIAAGLAAGTAVAICAELVSRPATGTRAAQIEALAWPTLVAAGVAVLALVTWLLVGRRWSALAGTGTAFALLLVVGLPIGTTASEAWAARDKPGSGHYASKAWKIYPDEMAAVRWLAKNSGPDDVVLSNTFCRPPGARLRGCDARGFVISGVAGRRTFLDGWAYTQPGMAAHGVKGVKYFFQPSPWPDRLELTTRALTAPTPQLLDQLWTRYGVRWIYADPRNGPVSATLDDLAVVRFRQSQVKVYELAAP
ncbi:hypothetical protein Kfla_0492 [Kribbella flavida DSM 17836]|uniref:Uncharacterized protein n=1 Tax=Kribbella flavida (strain DSM 17836 / JCM 10339 / NBRC 14399) TaxID=479435 RepID=D2PVV7_KRIFD|nr:hypothetical protein [Kribbella flavida]ADB29614.1 hypothetical protein Kfla_0492 [Kribbella flavida DSM 17836]